MMLQLFENGRKFYGKTHCKTLIPNKRTLRINQAHSKSIEKCFVFIIFECSHGVISKMYLLEFCFKNLPFLKSAIKRCAIFL